MLQRLCFAAMLVAACATTSHAAPLDRSLIQAVQDGSEKQVQRLINDRANVNAQDEAGVSALSWAILRNNTSLVKLLLKARANPNLADANGIVPLLTAVEMDSPYISQVLVRAGANPNATRPNGESALMIAVRVGSEPIARMLLEAGANPNARESNFDQTALMWAAGRPELTRLLLSKGAKTDAVTKIWVTRTTIYTPVVSTLGITGIPWNNAGDYGAKAGGYNALLFAAQQGDLESVKALIEAGMDVNFASADGTTPLLASLYRWTPGPPPPIGPATQGEGDQQPVVYSPAIETARYLLQRGAKPNVSDRAGYTPLHAAVLRFVPPDARGRVLIGFRSNKRSKLTDEVRAVQDPDALALIKVLLERGADANKQTASTTPGPLGAVKINPAPPGSSPLHIAAATRNVEVVNALLAHGANPNLVRQDGHTPFTLAVVFNDLNEVRAMVERGADIKMVYNPDDKIPDPVLSKAEQHGNQTIMHIAGVANADTVIGYLVSQGATTNAKNSVGMTPYDEADAQERFRYAHDIEGGVNGRTEKEIVRNTLTTEAFKKLGITGTKIAAK